MQTLRTQSTGRPDVSPKPKTLNCLSTFSFLNPPGYHLNFLNLEGISLKSHRGFGILGRNFVFFFHPQKVHFQLLLPQKGCIWPNLHLKISPQNSEALMRFQAYSFEIQKVQVISWGGGQGTRKCSEPLKHDFLAHFGRSEVFWPKR